ncbi:NAD-dependent epimerase/dehydratase family protein [Sulfuricurvum sp.]|uniref:NAD-dependent epimerase/dehydratase family protein n=1 Tax=Sulfuricurvum sp. TaxID=2025608 RepID=UPI003563427C
MKILLTGATGFIGNYFKNNNRFDEVVPFSFQHGNINNSDFSNYDAILHLAALVHQMKTTDFAEYEAINVQKTLELAVKAKRDGVKHFIFMSTVKVYGEENDAVYTENTPCNPQDDYGKSKFHAEYELQKLIDTEFTVSIIRTPIVYGAGVKANIRNLIDLIKKLPVLPFKDTHNLRTMVYIGNLYALIESVIEHRINGIFLACDDTSISTTEFIQKVSVSLGKKRYLIHIPLFEIALKYLKPSFHKRLFGNLIIDNTQTKVQLGYHNPYSMDEGIDNMIRGKQQ